MRYVWGEGLNSVVLRGGGGISRNAERSAKSCFGQTEWQTTNREKQSTCRTLTRDVLSCPRAKRGRERESEGARSEEERF